MKHFFLTFTLFITFSLFSLEPKTALQHLKKGNERYVHDEMLHPNHTSIRREELTERQKPFAIVVGCSDSRVPPEILFDQGIGDIFVVRIAGNVVGPIECNSIEYVAKYLGSCLIVVLGHESCGAVQAVFKGQTEDIEDIALLIGPVLKKSEPKTIEAAVKDNVRSVVSHLQTVPFLEKLITKGTLKVVGGYYHLSDGHVEWLN